MKKLNILFFALLFACSLHAFDIVKDGKSVSVSIPEKASEAEKFAKKELETYLAKITGTEVNGLLPGKILMGTPESRKDLPSIVAEKLKKSENDIIEMDESLKKILTEIKVQQNSFIRQSKDLREAIEYLKVQIIQKKKEYDENYSAQNKEKMENELEINKVTNLLKMQEEKTALAELSRNSLKNDLNKKKAQYDSLGKTVFIKKSVTIKSKSPKNMNISVGNSTTNLRQKSTKLVNVK